MKVPFFDIKAFAVEYFWSWEMGEDFDWLKKEWVKFEEHFSTKEEAETFILVLSYIYSSFCHESFFLKSSEGKMTVKEYIDDFIPQHPEFIERIEGKIIPTLNLLLRVYNNPTEVLRELVSIAIGFELPHPDGYKYIEWLFRDRYKEPDVEDAIF
jgi:hypothetical protein